ncbi:prolyl oligopeptidase family serine peptidase [Spirillospora sp. CA-294931]|uniref:prolyl oligopeptidase family serine peptidase n=1 Tax=Spirillospora sp. CA-294931 TaxID=3240042 RepID=UPI003D923263
MVRWKRWLGTLVAGAVLGAQSVGVAAAAPDERTTYRGQIDGATYRVVVPKKWNRTLVLFSHGYYPEGFTVPGDDVALSNHPQTAEWLLDHGYALAASDYKGKYGYAVEPALTDQIALLDWFGKKVGKPRRTVTSGQSMGGIVSMLLSERNPKRFAGVTAICASFDFSGYMNTALDLNFAVKTLLAPGEDIDLVRPKDPAASALALSNAIDRALKTPEGRARLALVGSLGNVPAWYSVYDAKPTELAEKIRQQAMWVQGAYTLGNGPIGRSDIVRRAGGNPSWNVGVDYGRQLARSGQKTLVALAYRRAGIAVKDDLKRLADAPRIAADPAAVPYLFRYGVARGTTPSPVMAIHNTGDGGAPAYGQRWYASQVRKNGSPSKLRQTYVDRGSHCAFTAAEEIVAIRNLIERLDTGRWPSMSPARLNKLAAAYPEPYQIPVNFLSEEQKVAKPAFTAFSPGFPMRPSR